MKKTIALPKTPAAIADLLYKTREERYLIQKQVDRLASIEHAAKEWFIANLPKSQASGIAGKLARVQLDKKRVPQVEDWPAFYKYVKKHEAFELLQRRLSDSAVKERLEEGEKIPGVGTFTAITVSCTKL